MSEQVLFENMLVEADINEVEASHGSNTADTGYNLDGTNTDGKKLGFARSVVSKTLPALISYVQPIDYPSGYIFGLRARGGVSSAISLDPDNIEYQGTGTETTINVDDPYVGHNTQQEMTVARKAINTGLREVVINTTNEVEQDIKALFGADYSDTYKNIEIAGSGEKKNVAKFFNEFAFSEMVKKTNQEFTTWLQASATAVGTATIAGGDVEKVVAVLGEMEAELMVNRGKVGGRAWVVCTPVTAGLLSAIKGAYDNETSDYSRVKVPNSYDNTYVASLGNIDIFMSPYFSAGEHVVMGITGGPNSASVYYTPYKEYVVVGGSDINTGHNNFFYRVRDKWETNPLDTYGGVEPSTGSEVTPVANASDYLVKATITYTKLLIVT